MKEQSTEGRAASAAPLPQEVAVRARDLGGGYDATMTVSQVSLEVAAGQFVALVGPNGAGKSTVLRLISGAIPHRTGSVEILGSPLSSYDARSLARALSYVPQTEPALFDFTVREVVLMGRHAHLARFSSETAADHDVASRAMAMTDVLHLADRPVTALSGGEHRRVLVARAIAQETPVILLDEPTAHLDMIHQFEVLALMRRLCRQKGTAVLAALHDLNAAAEHCDALVLIAGGTVVAEGTPEQVLTRDLVSEAYGGPVVVARNPVTGSPLLVPGIERAGGVGRHGLRVHVVCGGGTGAEALTELVRHGYTVTAGVLNRMDSDEITASALGIACVTEVPFSPIGDEAYDEARAMACAADVVVVTGIPLGRGNVRNLELAASAAREGACLVLLDQTPVELRDFTDGRGTQLWRDLEQLARYRVTRLAALTRCLRAMEGSHAGR